MVLGTHFDLTACLIAAVNQFQKATDFFDAETEFPSAQDKAEAADMSFVINTVVVGAARRLRQKANFFVVADSFQIGAGPTRQLAAFYPPPDCAIRHGEKTLDPVVTTERISVPNSNQRAIFMSDISTKLADSPGIGKTSAQRHGWLAAGGVVGAILASACCVVPLLLVTLGVSGAWIGNLTALEPYKPYVAAVTMGLIGIGFWRIYFQPKAACEDGSYCARPESSLITKSALWIGAFVTLLAVTINWWAPLFY